jgi:enoyl-[acyl-carrier protein] reductase III
MPFQGKVALVTGSSRGIGRAIALELARGGADIVVNYFRKRSEAHETVRDIESLGVRAISIRADLANPEAIEALFAGTIDAFGGADILVCNAATGVFKSALDLDKRNWDWTLDINALSVLRCAQQVVPMMERRGGGRIVAVSSIGRQHVLPLYCAVGASKGALETITRYLAVELAPKKIITNCVAPGAMSNFERAYPGEGSQRIATEALRRTPVGRILDPEDVAKVVAFLCRFDIEGIVGQTIIVDGGFSITT